MQAKVILHSFLAAVLLTSCEKDAPAVSLPVANLDFTYSGEEAVKVRDETIVELLSVKESVDLSMLEYSDVESIDRFAEDLRSYRPRLEYIHMQTDRLPEKEQMVVRGNLAVASNQLEKKLLAMLQKSPGHDDLIMEIDHLQEQLSPIPIRDLVE